MKKDVRSLFIDELEDMLSAEKQIVEALPKMANAAESTALKDTFKAHLLETKEQVRRLEQIFRLLKVESKAKLCKAAKGLIQEGQEAIEEFEKSTLRDAALISKAQRIEHYEISAYGTLSALARELDLDEAEDLLEDSLSEEANADKKLNKLALGGFLTSGINHQAHLKTEGKQKVMVIKKKTTATTKSKPKAKKTATKTSHTLKAKTTAAKKKTAPKKKTTSRPKTTAARKTTARKTTARKTTAKKTISRTSLAVKSRKAPAKKTTSTAKRTVRSKTTVARKPAARKSTARPAAKKSETSHAKKHAGSLNARRQLKTHAKEFNFSRIAKHTPSARPAYFR